MQCPKCNNPLDPGSRFCGECGAPAASPAPPSTTCTQHSGRILKLPDGTPGLMFVEGLGQKPFVLDAAWQSPTAPTLDQIVTVELDDQGNVIAIRPNPSPSDRGKQTFISNISASGFGRFWKHILLGIIISGLLSSIPLFNMFNCCFCFLNITGVIIALILFLKQNSQDLMTNGEAAGFGAAIGIGAGIIVSLVGIVINLLFRPIIMSLLPNEVQDLYFKFSGAGIIAGILLTPVNMILYGAFGALGGFLGLTLFFKDRVRRS